MTDGEMKRPEAFASDEEYQVYLAEIEIGPPSEDWGPVDFVSPQAEFELRLREAQDELNNLRARLAVIKEQATTLVTAGAEWADASAHEQLGEYPWAKLAGVMAASFVGARLFRLLPFGAVASAAAPIVISAIQARSQGSRRRRSR